MSQPNKSSFIEKIGMQMKHYAKWVALAAIVGLACGTASAIFLFLLDVATEFRIGHSWLFYLLPLGGLLVGGLYHSFGKSVEGGNNLIIDEFHDPKSVIPFRMAPLVLLGTIFTHLFGGSAGREGTAVQMGASIADQLTKILKLHHSSRQKLLMAGMAGGFGSVFGVPFAGTVFGLEVLAIGRLELRAFVECAVAAFVAHYVTLSFGIHHTAYPHITVPAFLVHDIFFILIAGLAFGMAARLFALLTESIKANSKKIIPYLPLRAFAGGVVIAAIFIGAPFMQKFAGLGVPVIVSSLKETHPLYDWFGKLFMTALTLGTGFKGGEVTPLLFIGSTLGNALSSVLPVALPVLASVGLVAVFAGAANTPFACTVMAAELFGTEIALYAAIGCFVSYFVSGNHGIYHTQRIYRPKNGILLALKSLFADR